MVSITRVFRLGIKVAAWATPRIKEWHHQRHLNRIEGQRHLGTRNWAEAEKHLTLALDEKHHSAKRRVELLLDLQTSQCRQGKLADAERTVRTAIDLAVKERNHSLHGLALDALVDVQLEQKQYHEAQKTTEEITRLEKAQPRPDVARLAQCSRKLGTALLNCDRSAAAMEAFQRAAKLSEQAFGPAHLETANSLAELGKLHGQNGNHAEAQRCLRRALEIHRAVSGRNSREAAEDLSHLAASLADSGDLEGAVQEYERVVALHENQVGGDQQEKAEAQVHLATLYVCVGRPDPARELLTHAMGVLQRKGGEKMLLALETMACADEQVGRNEDAKKWREKALKLAVSQAGKSPSVAPSVPKAVS